MRELVFATNNGYKLQEIRSMLTPEYIISGLAEKGINEEIPEDHYTLEENAFQKAEFIWKRLGSSCFADDTGLEIDALKGEPGVFSARYSRVGQPVYHEMEVTAGNIRKVLEKLHGETYRKARFRTVIVLIMDGRHHSFEGVVNGSIADGECGSGGFGYDPIFIPDGSRLTFAEMEPSHKNRISHRALAVKKLVNFLTSTDTSDGFV